MAIDRMASATWSGELRGGRGRISTGSKVLSDAPYSFGTRFESAPGTNPEELIAAAHAACFSMAFANVIAGKGLKPREIETRATCSLEAQGGGFKITCMRLETRGEVPGIDAARFKELAKEAEAACPISNALRAGLQIELIATLDDYSR
ncbi:MAG: OsmC family protein [Candidatus Eremiobacteraeota bacterium]|nr:OsmC family protein [Candidatus Eremiobacteraeota bacterium]